jgi:hypothetical protein
VAAAALATPDRAALIFSAYCSGMRVDFHPPACVIAAKSISSSARSCAAPTRMQAVTEALNLLRRQTEIENAMKNPGGIRITEEEELHLFRRQLQQFPEAMQAVVQAAHALRRPIAELTAQDVEL